jgi:cysteine synthase A
MAVEPAAAPVLAGRPIRSTKHKIQGVGYAAVPPQWDQELCDGFVAITDAEATRVARALAKEEGILSGFSGGANVAAAMRLAREQQDHPRGGVIVTVIPDTGLKYLSTDLFH